MRAKFQIGTKYKTRGKMSRICTVVDILRTYNNAGELTSVRYISSYEFLGQTMLDRDVMETTILRGQINL